MQRYRDKDQSCQRGTCPAQAKEQIVPLQRVRADGANSSPRSLRDSCAGSQRPDHFFPEDLGGRV